MWISRIFKIMWNIYIIYKTVKISKSKYLKRELLYIQRALRSCPTEKYSASKIKSFVVTLHLITRINQWRVHSQQDGASTVLYTYTHPYKIWSLYLLSLTCQCALSKVILLRVSSLSIYPQATYVSLRKSIFSC